MSSSGQACVPSGVFFFAPAGGVFSRNAFSPTFGRKAAGGEPVFPDSGKLPGNIFFPGTGQGAALQHIAAKVNEWKVLPVCQRAKKGVPGFKEARFFRVRGAGRCRSRRAGMTGGSGGASVSAGRAKSLQSISSALSMSPPSRRGFPMSLPLARERCRGGHMKRITL